jgi:O-acetyl-ADP-ribose deacetylase (regulator of RNase III)
MIQFKIGNLLESNAQALVNTVNTDGIMGKGIALQFKNQFPNNYKEYLKACKDGSIDIGKLLVYEEDTLLNGNKLIINFPTKTSWRKPSEYSYIELGLKNLAEIIKVKKIKSIAIPPLGAGNGGLDWHNVKKLLIQFLQNVDCEIYIYEPNNEIKEILKKERVSLTPARAMLLSVLFELVKNGEFISEFSAEKIAYFLQKFGGKEVFNLDYKKNFYGPYSGKVKHVLYYLNGSYITGYSSKDKKPFENIGIIFDAEKDVNDFLNLPENIQYLEIANKTKKFLEGFYSNFGLELLSTVDFIKETENLNDPISIKNKIENWSDRKRTLFATKPDFINIALKNLNAI